MAKAHVYVRARVSGTNADCHAVNHLVSQLADVVESLGGDRSACHAELALDDEPAASVEPVEVAAVAAEDTEHAAD